MTIQDQPRRPNLATIVGSSLAVVAAGSLLAFSSLAEQAGLDGLAAGGLQPMSPGRSGGEAHAITVPAPSTAPPGDPRDALAALVDDTLAQREPGAAPAPRVAFETPRRDRTVTVDEPQPTRPARIEQRARVAVAEPEVARSETRIGPPYGHAYGYHKKDGGKPEPAQKNRRDERAAKKRVPGKSSGDAPVYARKANDDEAAEKPPKVEKLQKAKAPKGKANGHSKHGNGKAKGHAKHGNGNGNGHGKHAKGKGKAKGHGKRG